MRDIIIQYDPPSDAVVSRKHGDAPRVSSYDPALHRQSEWEAGAGGTVHDRGEEEKSSIAKVEGLLM